jgi:hypothetical protein
VNVVLALLDWLLGVVHLAIVLANLLLWLPRSLRRWHLGLLALTSASWFGLGAIYGVGYCVLTDWHWAIKRARGIEVRPSSFIHHLLVDGLGLPFSQSFVDTSTALTFACVVCLSIVLNVRDRRIAVSS